MNSVSCVHNSITNCLIVSQMPQNIYFELYRSTAAAFVQQFRCICLYSNEIHDYQGLLDEILNIYKVYSQLDIVYGYSMLNCSC